MKVGLENFKFFEDQMRLQKRIWNDACDVGVPVLSDETRNLYRNNIRDLMKYFKYTVDNNPDLHFSTIKVFVPWEVDDNLYSGSKLTLTHFKEHKGRIEYFSVYIENHSQFESPWRD